MQNGNIDIHCHFFNISFAFAEVLEIGWRWIHGNYPYKSDEQVRLRALKIIPPELRKLANYVAAYFAAATGSPDEHYDYEQRCCRNSQWHPSQPLMTVPLMMDIFFMFDNGRTEQERTRMLTSPGMQHRDALKVTTVTEDNAAFFDEFAQLMKAEFIPVYKKKASARDLAPALSGKYMTGIRDDLDRVIEDFKGGHADEGVRTMSRSCTQRNVQMTRGYRKHLQELQRLEQESPAGTVLPFLAVDPRRVGIEELVREQVVEGEFKGVKLYPPLGYLPSHPNLYPVYSLCMKHNIPVTVHTSVGGLLSLCDTIQTRSKKKDGRVVHLTFDKKTDKSAALFFSNPAKWVEILENPEFSGLHLNFAHFGGEEHIINLANQKPDDPGNWTAQIIGLMERFSNVYADISYCPNDGMLKYIKAIVERYPIVQQRLMFGTDYIMVMKESSLDGSLGNYFNHYTGMYPEMKSVNPAAFLGKKSQTTEFQTGMNQCDWKRVTG
jgi:predicted TIM-barrel fold metal-dependent hydrolase